MSKINNLLGKMFIILAGAVFYIYAGINISIIFGISIVINYLLAIIIRKIKKKWMCGLAIIANVGLLLYFKYYNFIIITINNHSTKQYPTKEILLPLGISFFTFQQIMYLVSVYKEEIKEAKLLDYLAYILYFPKLIMGPLAEPKVVEDQYNGANGLLCTGCLQRPSEYEVSVPDYLRDTEYIGLKCSIDDISKYDYLTFYGKKISDHGQLSVYVYDNNGNVITECTDTYQNLDNEWHQYLVDVSQFEGNVTIIFNGGFIDNSGNADSQYVFSDITLY